MANRLTGTLASFIWLLLFCYCFSAPHKSLCEIQKSLSENGLSGISSTDGFEKSVHCIACVDTIKCEPEKMSWMLTRHSQMETHKNKAGWYLDKDKNVVKYKPKGRRT